MRAPSWYRVGTFSRSWYPVAVDAPMLQRQTHEPAARAGWCRLSGHNLASWTAAGRRWTLSGSCEPLIRLRQNRARPLPVGSCSDYRAALLLPVSASCTDSPTVVLWCFGLSIRPLSVAASLAALAALTLTPSLPHSPSPLCLSHIRWKNFFVHLRRNHSLWCGSSRIEHGSRWLSGWCYWRGRRHNRYWRHLSRNLPLWCH